MKISIFNSCLLIKIFFLQNFRFYLVFSYFVLNQMCSRQLIFPTNNFCYRTKLLKGVITILHVKKEVPTVDKPRIDTQ